MHTASFGDLGSRTSRHNDQFTTIDQLLEYSPLLKFLNTSIASIHLFFQWSLQCQDHWANRDPWPAGLSWGRVRSRAAQWGLIWPDTSWYCTNLYQTCPCRFGSPMRNLLDHLAHLEQLGLVLLKCWKCWKCCKWGRPELQGWTAGWFSPRILWFVCRWSRLLRSWSGSAPVPHPLDLSVMRHCDLVRVRSAWTQRTWNLAQVQDNSIYKYLHIFTIFCNSATFFLKYIMVWKTFVQRLCILYHIFSMNVSPGTSSHGHRHESNWRKEQHGRRWWGATHRNAEVPSQCETEV